MPDGEAVEKLLKARVAEADYPSDVPRNAENLRLWDQIQQDIDGMPPGVVPDIPFEYTTMPDIGAATASKSAEADAYWTTGDGALKIAWTTAGAYDRALTYLGKYITNETELKGYCSKLYYQVLKTQPPTGDPDVI